MKKRSSNPRQRTISQLIFLVIIIVFAVITWFNNEQKSDKPKPSKSPKSTTVQPAQTHYDTVMANDRFGRNNVPFDYFQLALSWSPGFCDAQREKHGEIPAASRQQCDNDYGWVIHGLWPQSANAREPSGHPRFCQGDLAPLPLETFTPYLNESPSVALLQGQWEKHGACAFQSPTNYFSRQQTLFNSLKLPTEAMNRKALFEWVKKHNPELRNVYLGSSKNELYICYDKSWNPIDCG